MAGTLNYDAVDDADIGGIHAQAMRQGDRFFSTITVGAFNATGITARMTIRETPTAPAVLTVSESSGLSWSARTPDAVLVIDLPATTTIAVPPWAGYLFAIKFDPGGSDEYTFLAGELTCLAEVTA